MPKNNEKLKNPFEVDLNDLPLKKIRLNNQDVYYISEDDLEIYMIKNCFNIYNLNDESLEYYGDIINKNLVLDYCLLYEIAAHIGLTLVSTDEEDDNEYKKFNNDLLDENDIALLKSISTSSIVFLILKETKFLYECDIKDEIKKLNIQKNKLEKDLQFIKDKIQLLVQRCNHEDLQIYTYGAARCNICEKYISWYCPNSPTKECDYE